MNQADWCRLTGFSVQAWNNYEGARTRISIDGAIALCRHGVTLDWIFLGELTRPESDRVCQQIFGAKFFGSGSIPRRSDELASPS